MLNYESFATALAECKDLFYIVPIFSHLFNLIFRLYKKKKQGKEKKKKLCIMNLKKVLSNVLLTNLNRISDFFATISK